MRANQLRRSERQPLIERYVSVVVALEDFQEAQHRVAGILYVVPHGKRHVTDIVGLKVEGAGLARGGKHAHAGLPFDVILPLVRIRVPVQLAHRAGRDLDQRCGDARGYREHLAVGDAYRSAFRLIGVCAIIRWLKLCGTWVAPTILSELSGPGTGAGRCKARLDQGHGRTLKPAHRSSWRALPAACA